MSESTRCWWCNGRLVGPGGVPGREPLFYRTVRTMDDGQVVRVHAKCEEDTENFFTVVSAQERI